MIPRLYLENETNFNHNGIGALTESLSAVVIEEANGIFDLEVTYPIHGEWFSEIQKMRIITALPNTGDEEHRFRINEIVKSTNPNVVIIKASTKTNDVSGSIIKEYKASKIPANTIMSGMKSKLFPPLNYDFITDITTSISVDWFMRNPLNAILGQEGSLVDALGGGELKRNNTNLYLYRRRGNENVARVAPSKNLRGLTVTESTKGLITRIQPYVIVTDYNDSSGEQTETVILGDVVDSPLVNNYPVQVVVPVDFGEYEITNKTDLDSKAKTYFKSMNPDCDKPNVELDLDLIQISDSSEYEKFRKFEAIKLFDTVSVYVPRYGVDSIVKINRVEFDVLREKVISIKAGQPRSSYSQSLEKTYNNKINDALVVINNKINTVQQSADGKTQVFRGPNEPDISVSNEGDLWFKVLGNGEVEMYTFDGAYWQPNIPAGMSEEISKKVEEFENSIEQQGKDIDESIIKANQAVEDAGFSKTLAEDAKALGVTASTLADEAKTNASTAMADAQEAIRQAGITGGVAADASAEATEAKRLAGLAEGNAQEALTKADASVTDASTALTNANKAFNKSIKSSAVAYTTSENGSTPPTTGWGTAIPSPSPDVYIWTRTTIILNDNTPVMSYSVGKIGAKGDQGLKGDTGATGGQGTQGIPGVNAPTIKSVVQQYYLSTSKTSQTGGSWVATVPVWSSGKYYWVRVLTTYSNNATSTSTPVLDNALNDSLVTALEAKTANQTLSTTVTQHATLIEGKANSTTVDALTGRVSTAEGSISTISGEVALKASTEDVDALTGRVTTAEGTITAQAGQIALRATTATVNALTGRVSTAEGKITTQAGLIELKASTEDVDTLTGRVSTAEGNITTQAGQIASKVSQTDFNALNGRVGAAESTITQQSGEIALRVTTATYNAGIGSKENTITKSTTAPAHLNGRLWLDTSVTPNILNRSTGTAWVKVTPTTPGEVGAYSAGAGSALAGRVTTAETSITSNTTAINLRATKTSVDTLTGRVSTAEGSITTIAGQVALKASKSDVNTLTGRVTTAEGTITAQAGQIALRATTATVNSLTGRVSTAEGSITTQAGQIALKANTTTVDSLTGRVSTAEGKITANTTAINLRATKTEVNTAIDDIEVGGRNYLLDSQYLSVAGGMARHTVKVGDNGYIEITSTSSGGYINNLGFNKSIALFNSNVEVGETYTVSFAVRSLDGSSSTIDYYDANAFVYNRMEGEMSDKFSRFHVTGVKVNSAFNMHMMFNDVGKFEIKEAKLEKGNKATDWSPAPEDVDASIATVQANLTVEADKITALNTKTAGNTTQIGTLQTSYNGLSSTVTELETGKVDNTAFSALEQNLSGFKTTVANTYADKTTVTQLAGQWTATVAKVDGHTSQLTTLGNQINLRLTKEQVAAEILKDNQVLDTRSTNQPPSWYYTNYPKQTVRELKTIAAIGLTIAGGTYATLTTDVSWGDNSGGAVEQTAKADNGVYQRRGTGTSWSSWARVADTSNILSQINLSTEGVLIQGKNIWLDGNTKINNAVIKTAHIADLAVSGAKIANASISSAKIISLDASKITANTLSAITTNTGNLNVSGNLTMTTDNNVIKGAYVYGEAENTAYIPRHFVGDFSLGRRYMGFTGDIYSATSTGGKGAFQNYSETYFGLDYFKMRNFDNRTAGRVLRSRIDMRNGRIEISDTWGQENLGSKTTLAYNFVNAQNVYAHDFLYTNRIIPHRGFSTFQINPDRLNGIPGLILSNAADGFAILPPDSRYAGFNVGTDGTPRVWSWAINNRTYSAAANVHVTGEGTLGRAVSARKYKMEINKEKLGNAKDILQIMPSSWLDKVEVSKGKIKQRYYGFIADEFHELGLTEVVQYGADGQVEGLAYDRISMYHNVILQDHEQQLSTVTQQLTTVATERLQHTLLLESKLLSLEKTVLQLQQEIEQLK